MTQEPSFEESRAPAPMPNDYATSSTTSLEGIRMKKRLCILGEAEGGLYSPGYVTRPAG